MALQLHLITLGWLAKFSKWIISLCFDSIHVWCCARYLLSQIAVTTGSLKLPTSNMQEQLHKPLSRKICGLLAISVHENKKTLNLFYHKNIFDRKWK